MKYVLTLLALVAVASAQGGVVAAWPIPQPDLVIPGFHVVIAGGNPIQWRPYVQHTVRIPHGVSEWWYDEGGALVMHAETLGWCQKGCTFIGHFPSPTWEAILDPLSRSENGVLTGKFSYTDGAGRKVVFHHVHATYVQDLFVNDISHALGGGDFMIETQP